MSGGERVLRSNESCAAKVTPTAAVGGDGATSRDQYAATTIAIILEKRVYLELLEVKHKSKVCTIYCSLVDYRYLVFAGKKVTSPVPASSSSSLGTSLP
jgi:hypothetical protein